MHGEIGLFSTFAAVNGPDDLFSINAPKASCIVRGIAVAVLGLAGGKRHGKS
jgi:hypothetical protein